MADNKSYIALDWVNDEIGDTLRQALESLEAFVKNPDDVTKLRFCMTYTFQASGSLKMIELHSPAQLSVELEALLGKSLSETDLTARTEQAAIVKKGLLILVDYLSQTAKTHTENPNDLLPILNEVRGALEGEEVTASDLFDPVIEPLEPLQTQEVSISEEEFDELIRKLRQSFQTGLIGIVRNTSLSENYDVVNKVTLKLEKVSEKTASYGFWEIASALTESLLLQNEEANIDAKKALKQIDNQLKQLHDEGRTVFNQSVDASFVNTLLYSVATDEKPTQKIITLRNKYNLQDSVEHKKQLSLQERLHDKINKSIEETAIEPSKDVASLRTASLISGVLLSSRDELVNYLEHHSVDLDGFYQRLSVLLEVNRDRLELIKEHIVEFVATQWEKEAIRDLPVLLDDVIGDLELSCFLELLPLLVTVRSYIQTELLEASSPAPEIAQIETLADIISSVEYFLECFSSQAQQQLNNILQVAKESIAALNYDAPPTFIDSAEESETVLEQTEEQQEYGDALNLDIDEEILDIFIEEAEEVSVNIDEFLPKLHDNLNDEYALTELRRSFHTLKGSGRMVGADAIGEFAWSVEKMLNKVVEGGADLTNHAVTIMEKAAALIPELLTCFRNKKAVNQALLDQIITLANAECLGESLQANTVKGGSIADDDPVLVDEVASTGDFSSEGNIEVDISAVMTEESVDLDIDDEIFEIFVEEAQEVLEAIQAYLPKIEADPSDAVSLTEIRRAYHTLKGSGRMVGADAIGEFAWSIERMLNKIMDGGLELDPYVTYIVKYATAFIPALVSCFEQKKAVNASSIAEVVGRADAHWAGKEYVAVTLQPEIELNVEPAHETATNAALHELTQDELIQNGENSNDIPEVEEDADLTASLAIGTESVSDHEIKEAVETLSESIDPVADVTENGEELDELAEIFIAEAQTHIDVLSTFLNEIDPGFSDVEVSHDLQRAFHTLKGSAQMADMQDMSIIASPLEDLIKDLANFQIKADAEVLALLMQANEILVESLEAIQQVSSISQERITLFVNDVEKLHKEKINGKAANAEVESEDKQLEILTKALECLTEAADIHATWQTDAESLSAEDKGQLPEVLSTLAVTADNANYPEVASLADALAAFYSRAITCEYEGHIFTAFFELANTAQDELDDMLDFVAANQKVEPAIETITKLLDFDSVENEGKDAHEAIEEVAEIIKQDSIAASERTINVDVKAFTQQLMAADEEMLDIFLEEANELYEELDEVFAAWSADTANMSFVQEMKRILHTLKGGARLAELTELGDIVHNYESEIEKHELKQDFNDDFFADSKAYQAGIDKLMVASEKDPRQVMAELESQGEDAAAPLSTTEAIIENSEVVEQTLAPKNPDDMFVRLTAEVQAADEETLEIFIEEAGELAQELEASANAWISDHDKVDCAASLKRVLHTLKGGARLSEIKTLGDLTHDYESMIEKYEVTGHYPDTFFTQIEFYQGVVDQAIEILIANAPKPQAQPEMTITETAPVTVEVAPTSEPINLADVETTLNIQLEDIDSELLTLFVEESIEHIESIEVATASLLSGGNKKSALDELKRVLHTLKGGARLAGVTDIGDVSHDFETYIINAERESSTDDDGFIDEIQSYQDTLNNLTEEVQRLADITNQASRQELIQSNVIPIRPGLEAQTVNQAAIDATRSFIESLNKDRSRGNKEAIKLLPEQLQGMINLAGESLISRSRVEEVMSEMGFSLDEMDATVDRLHGQLRRMEIETEAQMTSRFEQMEVEGQENFDPLEMDRYSSMQQLSKLLIESASDLEDISDTINNKMRDMETILIQMGRINNGLQESLMRAQMVPFSRMVPRLHRIIRQVAGELGKKVDFNVENADGELDRTILEKMIAPLEHMLRNAVDHGIEMPADRVKSGKPELGNIRLSLTREGGEVVLTLRDNGAGVNVNAVRKKAIERGLMQEDTQLSDNEIAQFIMHAGFSTAEKVTQISGRGVGMDVVHSEIKQMGGVVEIESEQGVGSTFVVRLPFTVSVNRALMVTMGGDTFAIPLNTIDGIVRVSPYELEAYYQPDAPPFEYAGQNYKLKYMGGLLQRGKVANLEGKTTPLPVILIRSTDYSVAVQVDQLLGSQEVVVKSLGPQFSMVEGVTGATVMGNGDVVVILDMLALIREDSQRHIDEFAETTVMDDTSYEEERPLKVMVTDDSVTVRKVTSRFLERQGFEVVLAKDGQDAVTQLGEMSQLPDLMLLDIEMPRMDGFEVLSRVRHNAKLQHIHVVMITSRTGDKHRDRALSLGASRYLGKPFQENELLQVIGELTGAEVLEA